MSINNPLSTFSQLHTRIAEWQAADIEVRRIENKLRQPYGGEPQFHVAQAPPHWEAVGQAVGMPGMEVSIVMENVLRDPTHPVVIGAVRQLLMMGKIMSGELIGEHRARLASDREKHAHQVEVYHRHMAQFEAGKLRLEDLRQQRDEAYRDLWPSIVSELEQHCEAASYHYNGLHPRMKTAMDIMDKQSRFVVFDRTNTDDITFTVSWEQFPKFKGSHVAAILDWFNRHEVFGDATTDETPGA